MDIHNYIFYFSLFIGYIFYFIGYFQILQLEQYQEYSNTLQIFIQTYIALYLFIRFRPFHKIYLTNLDKEIIFQASIFLLMTSILNYYIIQMKAWILSYKIF
jgi:hypothetical protein